MAILCADEEKQNEYELEGRMGTMQQLEVYIISFKLNFSMRDTEWSIVRI